MFVAIWFIFFILLLNFYIFFFFFFFQAEDGIRDKLVTGVQTCALPISAFVAHPYRRPVIGTAESVERIAERDLVDFFRSYYVADNLTLVVAGDVDPVRVRRSVERRFRAMPTGRPTRQLATEPEQTAPRATALERDVGEAYLAVGFHVPAARHPDLAALDVAAILLGQAESARLPRLLRDRDRLATSAYANVHALRDPGLLVLSATARAADASKVIGALADQA